MPARRTLPTAASLADLVGMAGPFLGDQVVMDCPLARIENQIVDDHPAYAAFEQRAALVVVGEEVADDGRSRWCCRG